MIVLGGGALGRWLGHKGETLINGINALTKEATERSLPSWPCEGTIRSLQPGRGLSHHHVSTLILDFQPSELWEINFCCLFFKKERKWELINNHGWTGTNHVLISTDVINPGDDWPEFVLWFHQGGWECCHLSGMWSIPVGGHETGQGVWRPPQWIDPGVDAAFLDVGDFLPNADPGVTESIQLCLVFWLSGLNHESACHWPGHGRGMKSIILKPFGHIHGLHICRLFEGSYIQNKFMSHVTSCTLEKDSVVFF